MIPLIKLYVIIGLVWALLFIGVWIWRRRDNIDFRDVFEIGILTMIFVCTWLAWPWSIYNNISYVLKGDI
jgi:hypothetical protein